MNVSTRSPVLHTAEPLRAQRLVHLQDSLAMVPELFDQRFSHTAAGTDSNSHPTMNHT